MAGEESPWARPLPTGSEDTQAVPSTAPAPGQPPASGPWGQTWGPGAGQGASGPEPGVTVPSPDPRSWEPGAEAGRGPGALAPPQAPQFGPARDAHPYRLPSYGQGVGFAGSGSYQQAPYQQAPYQQARYQQAPYQQPPYQQPPYQQPPYQQAPYPYRSPVAPRQPRNPGRVVGLVVVAVVGVVILGLVGVAGGYALGRYAPVAGPTPVRQVASTPAGQTAGPTAAPSTTPGSPAPPPTSGPSVYSDQPELVTSTLYPLTAPPLECPGLKLPTPSGKALEPWAKQAIECLHRHYRPIVEKAGFELTMPTITFFTTSIDTPCGEGTGAFYCGGNEGIYVERGVYDTEADDRLNAIRMLLHEFSHHVQQRAGILDVGVDAEREDYPVVSRRIELQVSCWTAIQLRGSAWLKWTATDEAWLKQINSTHSDKLHGSAKSRRYWYDQGRNARTFGACNTWVVDASKVE